MKASKIQVSRLQRAWALAFTLLCVGCATTGPKPKSIDEVLAGAEGEGVRMGVKVLKEKFEEKPPFGYQEKYAPLVVPPRTLWVWVAPRAELDAFYQGEWLLLVIGNWEFNRDILRSGRTSDARPSEQLPHFPAQEEDEEKK